MLTQGITQFQVKLGADANWEADVARLRLVREAVGDGPLVYGDWNCGATSLDAIRIGRAVRDLDIMLEQPCKTIEDCARVKASTQLPMKLDEAAKDTASLLKGHALGVMDAVALKLSKFGGLSETRKARDLCLYLGAKMCRMTKMYESMHSNLVDSSKHYQNQKNRSKKNFDPKN